MSARSKDHMRVLSWLRGLPPSLHMESRYQ